MLVRILKLQAGPAGVRQPGAIVELDDAEAKGLLEAGACEEAEFLDKVEADELERHPPEPAKKKAAKKKAAKKKASKRRPTR